MMSSHCNDDDSDASLLGEVSPPLAPNVTPASANPRLIVDTASPLPATQTGAPTPTATDIATRPVTVTGSTSNEYDYGGDVAPPVYDDGIFAEEVGDTESGLDPNGSRNETLPAPATVPMDIDDEYEGPPPFGMATADPSPLVNAAHGCAPAPANGANADADANTAPAITTNESPRTTPSQQLALGEFIASPSKQLWDRSVESLGGRRQRRLQSGDLVHSDNQDPHHSTLVEGGGSAESGSNNSQNQTQPESASLDIHGLKATEDNEAPSLSNSMTEKAVLDSLESPVQHHTSNENATCTGEGIELIKDISGPDQSSAILADSLEAEDIISKEATRSTNATRPTRPGIQRIEYIDGDENGQPLPPGIAQDMLDKWQPPDGDDDDDAARPQVTGIEMIEDNAGPDLQFDVPRKENISPWTNQPQGASVPIEDCSHFSIPSTSAEMGVRRSTNVEENVNENVDEENPRINDDVRNSSLDRPHVATVQEVAHVSNNPGEEMHFVPEAILVENGDVVIGTPLEPQLPWRKQRRTRVLLAVICVGVIALPISFWVSRSSSVNDVAAEVVTTTVIVEKSAPPSFSSPPSSSPSFSLGPSAIPSFMPSPLHSSSPSEIPSSSVAPSTSTPPSSSPSKTPSETPNQYPSWLPTMTQSSSPSMTHMDTLFETDCDQCWPYVAIYGDTAVVTRHFIDVNFFSLTKNSTFEVITKIDIDYKPTDVAINGNTAIIGSAYENECGGAIHIYEKDEEGIWYEAMNFEPDQVHGEAMAGEAYFISEGTLFGRSVSIYDDVFVVGADDDGEVGEGSAFIFRQDKNSSWVIEAKLVPSNNSIAEGYGYSVSVKGNTVVVGDMPYGDGQEGAVFVYEYESSSNSWIKSGDVLMNNDCSYFFANTVSLTDDEELLVGCYGDASIYYYKKQGKEDEYVLQQSIEFDNTIHSVKVDENVMVASEDRKDMSDVIHFFVRNNHVWQEVKTIDEPTFDTRFGYKIATSGNVTLIASTGNVYLSL